MFVWTYNDMSETLDVLKVAYKNDIIHEQQEFGRVQLNRVRINGIDDEEQCLPEGKTIFS